MKTKRLKIGILIAATAAYAAWAWVVPIDTLERRYGESGLTWGLLVFGVLIPYLVHFIISLFKPDQADG